MTTMNDPVIKNRKLLITGCGLSGTQYSSKVFQAIGLKITHEQPIPPNGQMGMDGIASWYMAVPAPDPPFGPSACDWAFDYIIHLVKHPLEVIPSTAQFILRADHRNWLYMANNIPEIALGLPNFDIIRKKDTLLMVAAARYRYFWNLETAKKATYRLQVEHFRKQVASPCESMDITYDRKLIDAIPNTINQRSICTSEKPWLLSWQTLGALDFQLSQSIKELTNIYNYIQ
ncbi:MAG: hypothetical protein ACJAUP_002702 [Cellvibrionaceae bacterium]|jgi:hypothetical protein